MAHPRSARPTSKRPAIWGLLLLLSFFGMWIILVLAAANFAGEG
jgi:hypothetical protein